MMHGNTKLKKKELVIYGFVTSKSGQNYKWFRKLVICTPLLAYE